MWDYESLYKKAKVYVRKALEHEQSASGEVPLWSILSLEFLARATLSRVNPALLADPRDGASVLHACGYPSKKAPTSVPAKTVFHRCVVVCEEFTEQDYNMCLEWLNLRNEELHTGELPFELLRTSSWLPDFFRICVKLLSQNESSLEDFVGPDHAPTATDMISALSAQKRSEAFASVQQKKSEFRNLGIEERLERIRDGKEHMKREYVLRSRGKEVSCPACEGSALVIGNLVRSTTPRDNEGEFVQDDVWLPAALRCWCCGLRFTEHAHVSALGFGDQFVTADVLDPKEYYDIQFDPSEYFESYYDNE